jgi:ATP-dependent Clp protease ATP-binding subunit ClpC
MIDGSMNNFTPRTQQVLALARKEANRFNQNSVGPEHLLLGLIKLGQGVAVHVLQSLGVDLEGVRMAMENLATAAPGQKMTGKIPFTPRAKKVLALAANEAQALHHGYVGTEHLLLGLLHEAESAAAQFLKNVNVDLDETRRAVLKELNSDYLDEGELAAQAAQGPIRVEKNGEVRTPALKTFGRDLTEIARQGQMDPVIGREAEIERLLQILCRRRKSNPVLLGEGPAWARLRSSKAWLRKSSERTFRNSCAKSAWSPWTWP